nr:PucR family transcriptional regulator [Lacisediminihabitans profunda]
MDAADRALLPSIRDILRLDAVASGMPEVLAGESKLDNPVRWVHVTETTGTASLVNGGELLLSTGVGWPQGEHGLDGYVEGLALVGVAGLILELGARFKTAPSRLLEQCRTHDFPLIVLHRETRFIAITEAVHGRIISDQMIALRARDEIHALFTELSLRGSPADFIVAQVGRALGAPVVLENLNHQVVAIESLDFGDDVLIDWEQRSRMAHREFAIRAPDSVESDDDQRWTITPVEARGIRWGYLIALPGQRHPAGRVNVLEQAAVALALSRLADRDADEWTRQSHQHLLTALLGRRYRSETGLAARFEAAGVPVRDRRWVGVAVSHWNAATCGAAARAAAREIGGDALAGVAPTPGSAHLIVALSLPKNLLLTDQALALFARRFALECGIDGDELVVAVGEEAVDVAGLLSSLEEAAELLRHHGSTHSRGLAVFRVKNRPLLRFVNSLGGDPRLQAHSEQMLRPLIDYDLRRGGDLLRVLLSYISHPGNRTQAAASSHLSRSVFYQRISLIEELLGADLNDGETVSALHTALLARRRSTR